MNDNNEIKNTVIIGKYIMYKNKQYYLLLITKDIGKKNRNPDHTNPSVFRYAK